MMNRAEERYDQPPAEDVAAPESTVGDQPTGDAAPSTETLQAELADAKDRTLRLHAELDNYRKRAERQMADERRYAEMALLRNLLPVLDNVNRAIEAGEKSSGGEGLLQGVRLVAEQLENVFRQHHCLRIKAAGTAFDPNLHQAIVHQPSAEHPANEVILEALPGYKLHDRVVRPTQVIVSSGPPPE